MTLSNCDQIILASAKIHLSDEELRGLNRLAENVTDWDETVNRVINRAAGPLLYSKLPLLEASLQIPEDAKEKLRQSYFVTMSRSMMLYDAFSKVTKILHETEIKTVALKGIHLAEWLYGDIGLRQMSDIDLLVRKEDASKTLTVLEKNGYISYHNEVSDMISEQSGIVHFQPMQKGGVSVEVHINLHRKRKKYQLNPDDFIERAQPLTLNKSNTDVLEIHDLIIFLCVHLDKHFVKGDMQFTGFYDLVNLIDTRPNEINWDILLKRTITLNAETIVFKYLILVSKFFRVSLPDEICNKYRYSVKEKDENLFRMYLNGYIAPNYEFAAHLKNLKQIQDFVSKMKYLSGVIFPDKQFMISAYNIKNHRFFWLYYPYRYWIGLKGFIRLLSVKNE